MATLTIDPTSLMSNPKDPREQVYFNVVLPHIQKTLKRYLYLDPGSTYELADLESLCWEPISIALETWRPTRCQSFVHWAQYHIQHELQKTFSGKDRDVWVEFEDGTTIRMPYTKYKKTAKALKAQKATITFHNLVTPLTFPDQATDDEELTDSNIWEPNTQSLVK